MRLGFFFLFLFSLFLGSTRFGVADAPPVPPVSPPTVTVAGDLPSTGTLSLADLQSLGSVTVPWTHDGETHQVRGVSLDKILTRFGFTSGAHGQHLKDNAERRSGWRKVVVASAPDGFQAVFSCAEFFEEIGPAQVLLVWEMDSKPLDAQAGPLRLVALNDKKGSRSIRQLQRLDVVDMRRIIPPMGAGGQKDAPK